MMRRPGPGRPFPQKTSQRPVSGLAGPIEGRSKQRKIRASPWYQTCDRVSQALWTKLIRHFRCKRRRIIAALLAAGTRLEEAKYLQSVSAQ